MIVGDLVSVEAAGTAGKIIWFSKVCTEIVINIELWRNAQGAFDAFPYEFGMEEDTLAG